MTQLIFDHLKSALGPDRVYMDVNIPVGADHRHHIGAVLPNCTLCLAIIGPNWSAKRAPDRVDYVHAELTALRARGVPIIPVLVDGATMPEPALLPPAVAEVTYIEAARVDSGRHFPAHFQQLLETIRAVHPRGKLESLFEHSVKLPSPSRPYLRIGAVIAAAAFVIAIGFFSLRATAGWFTSRAPGNGQPLPPPEGTAPADDERSSCTSPWSSPCASGECRGTIDGSDQFRFHLAGIYLDASKDPCRQKPIRDLQLCRGPQCLSQRDACSNATATAGAYTSDSFTVTGQELRDGFPIFIKEGGRPGALVALQPSYQQAMVKRPFLCTGGSFGRKALGTKAGPVEKLTYYLEPI